MKTEWIHKKLGDLGCSFSGLSGKTIDDFGEGKPFIPYMNIFTNGKIDPSKLEFVRIADNEHQNKVEKGDWFFTTSSETPEEVGMTSVLVDDIGEAYLNSFCFGFRLYNKEEIDPEFASYLFRSEELRKKISLFAQGSTRYNLPKQQMFDKLYFSYPASLPAQRRIAAILASADKVIAATQKTIAKYKQIKQGMMEDLLNEQCTMNNVQWRKVKLGECCTIHGRIGFRGYTTDDLVEKGYGAITFSPSDIHNFKLCYDDCDYITWKKYEESPEIKVFNGDILFCKTASIGKCAYVEGLKEKATINPQFVVLKNFQCDSKFLFYKLISYGFQTQVQGITGGSTIKTMSQEKLSLEEISVPDLPAQRRIAAILSGIDAKIAAEEKVLQKYEKVKKGLMERLLNEE